MLADNFGRTFSYLRLSLTSLCNYRCEYCLPNGNTFTPGCKTPLTLSEITRLVSAFSELGIRKIRLTGGEPALRSDLIQIISRVSQEVSETALTTNGFKLQKDVEAYRAAGLKGLNISIDSLDPSNFYKITKQNTLPQLLEGLHRAIELGGWNVKVNTVLMKGINDHELDAFLSWIRETPVTLRFIELMPTADNPLFFKKHYFDVQILKDQLLSHGWNAKASAHHAGPAQVFAHPDSRGRVGIIQPYSTNFCGGCNRLRITSQGELRLCLFGDKNYSLRSLLRFDHQQEELKDTIVSLLQSKSVAHRLQEDVYEGTRNFASIGG